MTPTPADLAREVAELRAFSFDAVDGEKYLLQDAVRAALLACADAWEREQWRPIESAPKDGTIVMLYGHYPPSALAPGFYMEAAYWDENCGGWTNLSVFNAGADCLHEPSHWRPLPAPPKEGATNE